MHRRQLLKAAALGTLATSFLSTAGPTQAQASQPKFKLHYAPHPRMFRNLAGEDYLDQIRFAADQGFTAWEDNGLPNLEPSMQSRVGELLQKLDMRMGVFVAYASFDQPSFVRPDLGMQDEILDKIKGAVEIAKRCGAQWFTVVPGSIDQQHPEIGEWNRYGGARLAKGYQTANAIELLKRCAGVLEPHELTMVLEPLNPHANHGGLFLQRSDQAYLICKAVDSPSCKILFDIYHQQITEGNLIPNIDHCWDEIGYMQAGDNPGRKEPGTGEINYQNVFAHLYARGFEGIIGMEHGNSQPGAEGERAVIEAYRRADDF